MKYIAIVTGYDCEPYIKDCYDSVISQGFDEVVFILDGLAGNALGRLFAGVGQGAFHQGDGFIDIEWFG